MEDQTPKKDAGPRTLWMYFREGLITAHKRRPISFYMLLSVPVVLALSAHLFESQDDIGSFRSALALLLVFFLVISVQAVRDFFAITRRHLQERHAAYLETLGERKFMKDLGERVKKSDDRDWLDE